MFYRKPATPSVSTPQTTKSTTRKAVLPTPNRPNKKVAAKGQATVTKAKVLVSRAKSVSTRQIAKTVKGTVAEKGAVKKVLVKKNFVAPKNPPDVGDSKRKNAPENSETNVKETVVVPKEKAMVDKSANTSVAESSKGTNVIIEENVSASKAETVSAMQKPKTPPGKLAAAGAVTKEKVEEMATKTESMPSKSTASENHHDVQTTKLEEFETKIQESAMVPKHPAEVVETANVTVSEPEHQTELAKVDVEDAEPMELGETGLEVAEPMEVDSCTEGNGEKPTTTEAVPEISATKSNEIQPLTSTVETQPDVSPKPPTIPTQSTDTTFKSSGDTSTQTPQTAIKGPETSVTAPPQAQQNTLPETESTGQDSETKTDTSHMKQQVAGNPVQADVEMKLTDGGVETKTMQKGMLDTI